mmetsp:Transcript_41304/g.123332  ORF Transcript_41304/g.123332 Transcript_41304/m.123332 type:complete len:291 (+) Transcript_41304:3224-4096(+)
MDSYSSTPSSTASYRWPSYILTEGVECVVWSGPLGRTQFRRSRGRQGPCPCKALALQRPCPHTLCRRERLHTYRYEQWHTRPTYILLGQLLCGIANACFDGGMRRDARVAVVAQQLAASQRLPLSACKRSERDASPQTHAHTSTPSEHQVVWPLLRVRAKRKQPAAALARVELQRRLAADLKWADVLVAACVLDRLCPLDLVQVCQNILNALAGLIAVQHERTLCVLHQLWRTSLKNAAPLARLCRHQLSGRPRRPRLRLAELRLPQLLCASDHGGALWQHTDRRRRVRR